MTNSTIRSDTKNLEFERAAERMKTLMVDGRAFSYQDAGSGPPVILAHCSGGSHRIWAPLTTALRDRYRVLAPDLLGYGRSEPWPPHARLHPWSDLGALIALAGAADEPVHLVGHSYGGTVALEAARVLGPRVRSLTVIEPVAFHLLRLTGRLREWQELTTVGHRMTAALREQRDTAAAYHYIRYWVGRMRWWSLTPRARREVVRTVAKVGAEFELVSRLSRSVGDYRSINVPTRLIAGARTTKPARAIVEELAYILPHAHVRVLPRAGHMSPQTHPREIAALVADHIDFIEASPHPDFESAAPAPAAPPRRSIA